MPRPLVTITLLALALVGGGVSASVYASARARTRQPPPSPVPSSAPRAAAPAASPAGGHGAHEAGSAHGAHSAGFDWGSATDRDLDVANVFLTARRAGVRAALDTLRAGARRDPELATLGHVVAHALGRFAVAQGDHDPRVYAQCTEEFQAGCWHGVMEGYFTSARAREASAVTPAALDGLCPSIVPAGAAPLARLECAHGMGHGLTARAGNDRGVALAACDALSDASVRGECHDGVFMELTVRATEPRPGTADSALLRPSDPRFPCDSVGAAYQPSCWAYQPIVVQAITHDVAAIARLCATVPAASVAACHHGLGKQLAGWYATDADVLAACRLGAAAALGACVAGAAESLIDDTWTPGPAMRLCRAAPNAAKGACYGMVGARMALIHPADAGADCRGAEPQFADVCRRGRTVATRP